MSYNQVVTIQILILFSIILIGVVTRKVKIMTNEVSKGVAELVLNVTLPLLIIVSFQIEFTKDMLINGVIVFGIAILVHSISIIMGNVLFSKFQTDKKKILKFATVFSNSAFMGFPVIESVFGEIGIFYCSIYVIVFNMFVWTYGIAVFTDNKELKIVKNVLLNPGVIAIIIGGLLFVFSIKLPETIFKVCTLVGGTTTPLAMLVVGASLADTKIKDIFNDKSVYYINIIRLAIIPLIVYFSLIFTGIDEIVIGVCVMIAAMPVAANTTIFAEKYKTNPEFASKCVFLTTVFSVVSLPLIMMLF